MRQRRSSVFRYNVSYPRTPWAGGGSGELHIYPPFLHKYLVGVGV
jgi:hypothetical protein